MNNFNKEFESPQNEFEVNIRETILRDYIPYWPVFLTFILIGLLAGKVFLRYQTPMYKVDAGILLNNASEETSEDLLKKAINGKENTNIEDEIEVLKGVSVIRRAIKKVNAQVAFFADGRVKVGSIYSKKQPFKVVLLNPDSAISMDLNFNVRYGDNYYLLNGKKYNYNSEVKINGNNLIIYLNDFSTKEDFKSFDKKISQLVLKIYSFEDAVKLFQSALKVEIDRKSSIINLSFTTNSKEKSHEWLKALVESYQEETQLEKRKKARFTMDFIDDRLSYVGKDLDSIESSLANYKKDHDIQKFSLEAQRIMKKVESGDQLAAQTELQLFVLEDLEKYVKGRISKPGMVPSSIGLTDANLNTYFDKLYDAENKYTVALASNGPNNDQVKLIKKEIETYKSSLLEIITNTRNNLLVIRNKASNDFDKYNREYDEVMRSLPSKERELLDISRQQEIKNALYKFLLEKREEAAIQMAGTLSDIRVVREPFGGEMVSPKIIYILLFFGSGFGLLVIIVLFIKNLSVSTLSGRNDLEIRTTIPILGEIVEVNIDSPLIMKDGNRSLIAEQFRGLRTSLNFYQQEKNTKILITSCIPGEGKSFCSTNIALAYALTGKRTVVIESDMRKPNLAKHLKVDRKIGLSSYLSGNSNIDSIIRNVEDIENLYVIPAGPIPPNPVELILNGKYADLLEQLSKDYEIIVIDCPPIGLVTDALEISKWVDVNLFITRQGITPKSAISTLLNRQVELGTMRNTGLILNGIKGGISGYGYGYDYGYQYSYNYSYQYKYNYGYYGNKTGEKNNSFLRITRNVIVDPFIAFFS